MFIDLRERHTHIDLRSISLLPPSGALTWDGTCCILVLETTFQPTEQPGQSYIRMYFNLVFKVILRNGAVVFILQRRKKLDKGDKLLVTGRRGRLHYFVFSSYLFSYVAVLTYS